SQELLYRVWNKNPFPPGSGEGVFLGSGIRSYPTMQDLLYFFQQLVNGLTIGSTYALIAIGYTMVYGIIGMINFAHGEIYMIGAYYPLTAITGHASIVIHLPLILPDTSTLWA